MANFPAITNLVADYLRAQLPNSNLKGWTIKDDSEAGDFDSDDCLALIAPDGTKSSVSVQCGPYGICVNRELYDSNGAFDGIESSPGRQTASHLLLRDIETAIKDAAADPTVPGPRM